MRARIWIGAAALVIATALASAAAGAAGPAADVTAKGDTETVTISGRAYAFNHMDTFLADATIKVRELPGLSATTDANGDYELELPDETTVTPYIDPPPGYNEIDLQTFHTRGEDIRNANFQTPADLEYNALAALLGVPIGADGRPKQCVIVTTASARNVRGVDYDTFEQRTPHGVAGATARSRPKLPKPTYFNEHVIPDPSQPSTSDDGGIIWTGVPAGSYRISTRAKGHRFAGLLASCEPGRIVNANPPWGAYELRRKESPLSAGVAIATARKVGATRRLVSVRLRVAERLSVQARLRFHGRTIGGGEFGFAHAGGASFGFAYPKRARGHEAILKLRFRDAGRGKARSSYRLELPS